MGRVPAFGLSEIPHTKALKSPGIVSTSRAHDLEK